MPERRKRHFLASIVHKINVWSYDHKKVAAVVRLILSVAFWVTLGVVLRYVFHAVKIH